MMKYAQKITIVVAVLASLTMICGSTALALGVWNSTANYAGGVLPSVGIGPEGAWSYGTTSAGSYNSANPLATPYSLVPYDQFSAGENRYWTTDGSGSVVWGADVWTGRFAMYTNGSGGWGSLLRWTAPRAMTIAISGEARAIAEVDSIWFIVRKNNETTALYQRILKTGPPPSNYEDQPITGGTVVVGVGDVIDVIAGLKAGSNPGSSWVVTNLTITEIPEPGALCALATGLLGLVGFVARRR